MGRRYSDLNPSGRKTRVTSKFGIRKSQAAYQRSAAPSDVSGLGILTVVSFRRLQFREKINGDDCRHTLYLSQFGNAACRHPWANISTKLY